MSVNFFFFLFKSEHTKEMCQQGRLLTACSVLHVQFSRARMKAWAQHISWMVAVPCTVPEVAELMLQVSLSPLAPLFKQVLFLLHLFNFLSSP